MFSLLCFSVVDASWNYSSLLCFSVVEMSWDYSLVSVHGLLLLQSTGSWVCRLQQLWFLGSRVQVQWLWYIGLPVPRRVASSQTRGWTPAPGIDRWILYHLRHQESLQSPNSQSLCHTVSPERPFSFFLNCHFVLTNQHLVNSYDLGQMI